MIPIQDFPYYGVEDGDSCYCGENADKLVPANPEECATPCTGDENEDCGNTFFRMNAYGPIFRAITPNLLIFQHETIFADYVIYFDLKLDGNESDEKQNIFGAMTEDSTYPDVASQIPAVFLNPDNTLEVCFELDDLTNCHTTTESVDLDTWFNLWIEQFCWTDSNGDSICGTWVWVGDDEWFWFINFSPDTYINVDGFMGNTYGEEFEAASGYFMDFHSETWATRDAPTNAAISETDFATFDTSDAVNAK